MKKDYRLKNINKLNTKDWLDLKKLSTAISSNINNWAKREEKEEDILKENMTRRNFSGLGRKLGEKTPLERSSRIQ